MSDGPTEEEFADGEDDPIIIKSKRVFINHADTYIGSNIASVSVNDTNLIN